MPQEVIQESPDQENIFSDGGGNNHSREEYQTQTFGIQLLHVDEEKSRYDSHSSNNRPLSQAKNRLNFQSEESVERKTPSPNKQSDLDLGKSRTEIQRIQIIDDYSEKSSLIIQGVSSNRTDQKKNLFNSGKSDYELSSISGKRVEEHNVSFLSSKRSIDVTFTSIRMGHASKRTTMKIKTPVEERKDYPAILIRRYDMVDENWGNRSQKS